MKKQQRPLRRTPSLRGIPVCHNEKCVKSIAIILILWYNYDNNAPIQRKERKISMLRYKKMTAFIASLVLCLSAASAFAPAAVADEPVTAASESTEEDGIRTSGSFSYSVTRDNTICIEDCDSSDKDLVIPAEIDGMAVAELGPRAFGSTPDQVYETISLPDSLNYISSNNPFIYCTSLKEIKLGSGNKDFVLSDGVLYTKDMKELICYPPKKSGSSYTVPDGVETVATAGIYSTELAEIKLPSSLKKTGNYSFSTNHNLKSADLSGTAVTNVSMALFADCPALTDVRFNPDTTVIDMGAFWGCTSLTEITIPDKVTQIGQNAFMDTGLKEVHIPPSVSKIDYCAFGYKTGTDGKSYPDDDFLIIGEYNSGAAAYAHDYDTEYEYKNDFAFMTEAEYAANKEISALDKATENDYTFAKINGEAYIYQCNASDSSLTVPETLGGLPVRGALPTAFSMCTAEMITLPEGFRELREMSFYNCQYLKEVVLPQSLEKIGDNCFDSCYQLETADCGGASDIGAEVFKDCESLREVTISGNCKDFGADMPFDTCSMLEEINVKGGSGGAYSSKDGVLFDASGDKLIEYPINRSGSVYKVPKGTKEIAAYAFAGCQNIKDVVLPKSLETVGDRAFYGCTSLEKLRAGKGLENIGTAAFGFNINPEYNGEDSVERDIVSEDFKLYAPKGSKAYDYAKDNDLKVVTGTVRIGSKNVSIVILALSGAVVLALICAIVFAAVKKSRSAKPSGKKKSSAKDKTGTSKNEKKSGDEKLERGPEGEDKKDEDK